MTMTDMYSENWCVLDERELQCENANKPHSNHEGKMFTERQQRKRCWKKR